MDIIINQICAACNGTGIRRYNPSPNAPLVEENPCSECGGDGRATSNLNMESAYFDEKFAAITAELDYIKAKVKKIWNKVKDGAPEE